MVSPTPPSDRADPGGTAARSRPTARASAPSGGSSGNTRAAQPRAAAAMTAQLVWFREIMLAERPHAARHGLLHGADQLGAARPSADPDRWRRSTARRARASTCCSSASGSHAENCVERVARRVAEPRELQRLVAPERFDERRAGSYALAAICRTSGAASSDAPPLASGPMISSRWPGCRFKPTLIARSA